MKYVGIYEYDVFVSYARVDNLFDPGVAEGWVTTFVRMLKNRLAQLLGREDAFTIFFDTSQAQNTQIQEMILQALDRSATLIAIVSNGYLASEYCLTEQRRFLERARDRQGDATRVFVVERDWVPREDQPPGLAELGRYPFWQKKGLSETPMTLPLVGTGAESALELLNRLAHELADKLGILRKVIAIVPSPKPPDEPRPSPKKRVLVVQAVGDPGSPIRTRADLVWESLIRPACLESGFEPVRAHELGTETVLEPIISSLFTDPLVVADLGKPEWNPNVMIEVGFRLAVGRSIVLLSDIELSEANLPIHLRDRRILTIDAADPQKSRSAIELYIRECKHESSTAWSSQYACVDWRLPVESENSDDAVYTLANEAAAKLYGFDDANEMIGKNIHNVDSFMCDFMEDEQRKRFAEDQERLVGNLLSPGKSGVQASVRVPLWFAKHRFPTHQNKVYLPLLVQHKFDKRSSSYLMRTVYVDITSWLARKLIDRDTSKVLRIPEMFRSTTRFEHDFFIAFDGINAGYMNRIRDKLECYECSNWGYRGGVDVVPTETIVQKMSQSRILVLPVGRLGMGQWEARPPVHAALLGHLRQKKPHILLLLPEMEGLTGDSWRNYLPDDYKAILSDSLYLPPMVVGPPQLDDQPGPPTMAERIIQQLLNVLRQLSSEECD